MKILKDTDRLIDSVERIHMIGIGGSGMSPLAELLHSRGYKLTGSDNNPSYTLDRVKNLGVPITIGHKAENVGDAQLVVYSAAINKANPELVEAANRGIPCIERSVLLGAVTRKFDHVIGVCGTHGKTTVSSMITSILLDAELDPSAVIGGVLPKIHSNCCVGESELLVCESCEYVDTFLQMSPDVAVLLNIDEDHMEYFKTVERLIKSFADFAGSAQKAVIVNGDDEKSMLAVKDVKSEIITFGYGENCRYRAENVYFEKGAFGCFDVTENGQKLFSVKLGVPGKHNVLNALGSAVAALHAGASYEAIQSALLTFGGAHRRFEILYDEGGITIADDYAHHPKELSVTLATAKQMEYNRVIAVFQPFTYSRTAMLLDDFAEALKIADITVLSEIMGSREVNDWNIYSSDLAAKIPNSTVCPDFEAIAKQVCSIAKEGDLIITMGCGDIYKVVPMIKEGLK